jgi:hypothetical protein
MTQKIYIISETLPSDDVQYHWEVAEKEYKDNGQPTPPELINYWYNFKGYVVDDPMQFSHPDKPHHGENGVSCDDAGHCICGPVSTKKEGLTWNVYIKFYETNPIVMYDPARPEYLDRMAYNEANNIKVEIKTIDTDDMWNVV